MLWSWEDETQTKKGSFAEKVLCATHIIVRLKSMGSLFETLNKYNVVLHCEP